MASATLNTTTLPAMPIAIVVTTSAASARRRRHARHARRISFNIAREIVAAFEAKATVQRRIVRRRAGPQDDETERPDRPSVSLETRKLLRRTPLRSVAGFPARVAGRSAALVIRRVVMIRVAWIATLGSVADALIALAFHVVRFTTRRRAGLDGGVRQCHRTSRDRARAGAPRQGIADERATGNRDVSARENGAEE